MESKQATVYLKDKEPLYISCYGCVSNSKGVAFKMLEGSCIFLWGEVQGFVDPFDKWKGET